MTTQITDEQIDRVRVEAAEAGDIVGAAIAARAIGVDYSEYALADRAKAGVDTMSVEQCRERVAAWLANAAAQAEGDVSDVHRTHRLYCEARSRVEGDEQLAPYSETILADYPEGDEHWQWVIDAPADEIVSWAKAANR